MYGYINYVYTYSISVLYYVLYTSTISDNLQFRPVIMSTIMIITLIMQLTAKNVYLCIITTSFCQLKRL